MDFAVNRQMGFCFKRNEKVAKAIVRLGCERVERARSNLRNCADTEAIHEARKEIKRARAVLRLARPNISNKEFRGVRKDLREAATRLAKPRDAAVKAATLRELTRRFKADLPAGAFGDLRVKLRRDAGACMRSFVENGQSSKVDRALRRAAKGFRGLKMRADGWDAVAPGVKSAYRRCRAAFRRALQTHCQEDFHRWRKSAKELWFQMKLLERLNFREMDRMAGELEAVGEHLGEDHDLFILRGTVRKKRPADMKRLEALIEARQQELRRCAMTTGKKFYEEKPAEFCERLGKYWRAREANERAI